MENKRISNLANPVFNTDALNYGSFKERLFKKVKFIHLSDNEGNHYLKVKLTHNNLDFTFNTSGSANHYISIKKIILGPYLPTIFGANFIYIYYSSQDSEKFAITMNKLKGENIYEIIPSTYPPFRTFKQIHSIYLKIDRILNPSSIDGFIFHDDI